MKLTAVCSRSTEKAAAFAANLGLHAIGTLAWLPFGRKPALTVGFCTGNRNMGLVLVSLASLVVQLQVFFTIAPGYENKQFSLVSYTAPESYFNANTASQQEVFDTDTGFFGDLHSPRGRTIYASIRTRF